MGNEGHRSNAVETSTMKAVRRLAGRFSFYDDGRSRVLLFGRR